MTHEDTSETPFEKKTERLDIRLSYQKKEDFTKACENQGDTPSQAVRRFVATYIRRARHDDRVAAIRVSPWKRRMAWAGSFIAAALIGSLIWSYTAYQKSAALTAKVFDIYDANQNGLIDLGEIAPDDFHLHRVLNIDGTDGISRSEFQTVGVMSWEFVDPDYYEILESKEGLFKQSTMTRSTIIINDGKPVDKFQTNYVKFDLQDPNQLEITVYKEDRIGSQSKSIAWSHRIVTWVEGRKTPERVMGRGRKNAVLTKQAAAAP